MKTLSSPSDDFDKKKPGGSYTNRAVGKSVPDRGDNPKRKVTWHAHDTVTGAYLGSAKGGQTAPKKMQGINREVSREGYSSYVVPPRKQF